MKQTAASLMLPTALFGSGQAQRHLLFILVMWLVAVCNGNATLYSVELIDNDGPHIIGVVDTTADTLTILTWMESPGGTAFWSANDLPRTYQAKSTIGNAYNVPDSWDGTMSGWGFLNPDNLYHSGWSEGTFSIDGFVFDGWGIGLVQFSYSGGGSTAWNVIPTGSSTFATASFDSVTISPATNTVWTGGGTNSLWFTPGNWAGGVVPTMVDTAVFDGTASNKEVTVDGPDAEWNTMVINSAQSYAFLGGDSLQPGPGGISVLAGEHLIGCPVRVLTDSTWNIATGTLLAVTESFESSKIITKSGGGILDLQPAFSGIGVGFEIIVADGTLLLNAPLGTGPIVVQSGATLGGAGSTAEDVTVQAGGTLSPGNSIGSFTISGNLTNAGTYHCEVSAAAADKLIVSNTLNLTGSMLDFAMLAAPTETAHVIASYGTLTGTFAAVSNLPPNFVLDYAYDDGFSSNNIALVAVLIPPYVVSIVPETLNVSPYSNDVSLVVTFSAPVANFNDYQDIIVNATNFDDGSNHEVLTPGPTNIFTVLISNFRVLDGVTNATMTMQVNTNSDVIGLGGLPLASSVTSDVIQVSANSYQLWAMDHGLTAGVNFSFTADADLDGNDNATEFMRGTDPLAGGDVLNRRVMIHDIGGTNYLTCTLPVPMGYEFRYFGTGALFSEAIYRGIWAYDELFVSDDLAAGFPSGDIQCIEVIPALDGPVAGYPDLPVLPDTHTYRTVRLSVGTESLPKGFFQWKTLPLPPP